jgi:FKBP-type peptidyl-prolyl cis-trans isomerase 2
MDPEQRRYVMSLVVWIFTTVLLGLQIGSTAVMAQPVDNAIAEGKKVIIEFSITLPESNTVIPKNVAQFVQGEHQMLPALEQALAGMKPGETKRVDLAADQAFGPYDETKKKTIARNDLPQSLKPGAVHKDEAGQPFTVVQVGDADAVVDYNHPLAGKRLVFDVRVVRVS